MKSIVIVTGRDQVRVHEAVGRLEAMAVFWHPWCKAHPVDAAADFRSLVLDPDFGSFAVVTFSSAILNVLGEMIEDGYLDRNCVKVLLAEDGEVRKFGFDSGGILSDGWPVGYFESSWEGW